MNKVTLVFTLLIIGFASQLSAQLRIAAISFNGRTTYSISEDAFGGTGAGIETSFIRNTLRAGILFTPKSNVQLDPTIRVNDVTAYGEVDAFGWLPWSLRPSLVGGIQTNILRTTNSTPETLPYAFAGIALSSNQANLEIGYKHSAEFSGPSVNLSLAIVPFGINSRGEPTFRSRGRGGCGAQQEIRRQWDRATRDNHRR